MAEPAPRSGTSRKGGDLPLRKAGSRAGTAVLTREIVQTADTRSNPRRIIRCLVDSHYAQSGDVAALGLISNDSGFADGQAGLKVT
jgi:hypothetical protein